MEGFCCYLKPSRGVEVPVPDEVHPFEGKCPILQCRGASTREADSGDPIQARWVARLARRSWGTCFHRTERAALVLALLIPAM